MVEVAIERSPEAAKKEKPLPLVVEILPGQAGEGLLDIYEAGTFEGKSLRTLVHTTLGKTAWTVEEGQVLDDIRRQLAGGRLVCRGREIQGSARDWAEIEETETGEKYWYVPVRVIKPQEGGSGSGPE